MNSTEQRFGLIEKIVFSFPLINLISLFFVQATETRGGIHLGHLRAIVYFGIIAIVISRYGLDIVTRKITLFLFYLSSLVIFSSDFTYSFMIYLKVVITLMMFPVGFFVLRDPAKLTFFMKSSVYAGFFLCINYLVAQVFKIGRSGYLEDSFYYGYAGIGSTVILSYLLLTIPLVVKEFKTTAEKCFLWMTIFLSILFTFIVLKRIAILALVVGFFVYLIKSRNIKKGVKVVSTLTILLTITTPLYFGTFKDRLDARMTDRNELTREQRYCDIKFAVSDFWSKGIRHALFGSEALNTPDYFKRNRQVHVDYANLLISSGVIGLLLYIMIYYSMIKWFTKLYRKAKDRMVINQLRFLEDVNGVFWAVLVASLVISLSGGMHVVGTRAILFVLLGGLTGVVFNLNKQKNTD